MKAVGVTGCSGIRTPTIVSKTIETRLFRDIPSVPRAGSIWGLNDFSYLRFGSPGGNFVVGFAFMMLMIFRASVKR